MQKGRHQYGGTEDSYQPEAYTKEEMVRQRAQLKKYILNSMIIEEEPDEAQNKGNYKLIY